jgi:protoheme IX farnesyltransferase
LKFSFTLLSLGSVLLFISGIAPFLLGLLTVILYNFLYTSLKKQTVFAIIPGALVGAIPPLIGYSASGISVINHDIIAFSLFMFLWQLPHFWLILIRYGKEYADAGFPTMLNYINEKKIVALVFSWVVLTTIILSFSGIEVFESNLKYPLMILNIGFILLFYRCLFIKNQPRAAFFLVNSFSLVLMLSLIFGAIFPGI